MTASFRSRRFCLPSARAAARARGNRGVSAPPWEVQDSGPRESLRPAAYPELNFKKSLVLWGGNCTNSCFSDESAPAATFLKLRGNACGSQARAAPPDPEQKARAKLLALSPGRDTPALQSCDPRPAGDLSVFASFRLGVGLLGRMPGSRISLHGHRTSGASLEDRERGTLWGLPEGGRALRPHFPLSRGHFCSHQLTRWLPKRDCVCGQTKCLFEGHGSPQTLEDTPTTVCAEPYPAGRRKSLSPGLPCNSRPRPQRSRALELPWAPGFPLPPGLGCSLLAPARLPKS